MGVGGAAVNGVKSTEDVTLVIPSMPSDPVFYTNSTSITPSRFGVSARCSSHLHSATV